MSVKWKQYQKEAATFFEKLGFTAVIEERVEGTRGIHDIDVFVTGSVYGIAFRWVIECKAWKNNIPKEKVMALISIVQDIGADRGFLLSEKGFQSGAVRAINNTNITLTSIDDLECIVKEDLAEAILSNFSWRVTKTKERLRVLKRISEEMEFKVLIPLGRLSILDFAISDAVRGEYPNIYKVDGDARHIANDFSEFAGSVEKIICQAEKIADELEGT